MPVAFESVTPALQDSSTLCSFIDNAAVRQPNEHSSAASHQAYRSIAPARWRTRGQRPLRPAEPRCPPLQQFAANRPDVLIQTHRRSNSKQVHSATNTADAARPRPHLASRYQIQPVFSLRLSARTTEGGKLRLLSLPDLSPKGH